jgi:hypothetical protein
MSEIISLHSSEKEENDKNVLSRVSNRFSSDNRERDPNDVDVQNIRKSRYATSSFIQLRWLIWRNFTDMFKNPFQIRLSIILAIVCFRLIFLIELFF